MNLGLNKLQSYPFEKLAKLLAGSKVPDHLQAINLSIGEPKHETPGFILEAVRESIALAASYPKTRGNDALREAIGDWLSQRFSLPAGTIDPQKHVLPVNGTREALFSFCQCVVNREQHDALILSPNPFYQIYEGAALLAGAEPWFINSATVSDFQTDYESVPGEIWNRCQLLYVCSPNNPTGNVISKETFCNLLELAEKYNFYIASDECYSEIYFDESSPPTGLLQAAAAMGNTDYTRCMVFHSLSKRSNVPGLRSGFVAGDADLISKFYQYRTYHGCAMAPFTQEASTRAWRDEAHVLENRALYRKKFEAVHEILKPVLNVTIPQASFYLWPETPVSDVDFAHGLYTQHNVTVLPGSYLSRTVNNTNPGLKRLRIALVASLEECKEAALRIAKYTKSI